MAHPINLRIDHNQQGSNRISRAILNMSIAFLVSKRGTCLRAKVGCVITQDHRIIATGYNGGLIDEECKDTCDITVGCKHAVHAEANAISFSAKLGIILEKATLYCTHQPCYECAKLIIQAGIKEVLYCLPYRLTEGIELLKDHHIKISQVDYVRIEDHIKV